MLVAVALVATTATADAGAVRTSRVTAVQAAAPEQPSISITITINAQGQTVVTIVVTAEGAFITFTVILHSDAVTLGSFTTDAQGNGGGDFAIPAGFTGAHSIELVNTKTGVSSFQAVQLPDAATTNQNAGVGAVNATPIAGAGATPPSTSGNDGLAFTGAAVVGIGVLAVLLLGAGGILLIMGRRRNERTR
jgi:hypothetical protein